MSCVLVPIDFSEVTERQIEVACRMAGCERLPVLLLHVAAPDPDYVDYRVGPQQERDALAEGLHEDRDRIHGLAARFEQGVEVESLVVMGQTAETILDEAIRRDAALIVIGSHGHGRLYDLIVGSVTESVLHSATCPVLVIPARSI